MYHCLKCKAEIAVDLTTDTRFLAQKTRIPLVCGLFCVKSKQTESEKEILVSFWALLGTK